MERHDAYNLIINDDRTHLETVYTSMPGMVIPNITGSASVISSFVIIVIIGRSRRKLQSVYHRILLGMSVGDIVASFAMALSTLPMPTDMIYEQVQGIVVGNTATCEAQGFLFFFGSNATFGYNVFLCVFYLCSIRYKISDAQFSKRLEPALHALAILLPLGCTTTAYVLGFLNPSPIDSWCTAVPLPYFCIDDYSCPALRPSEGGRGEAGRFVRLFLLVNLFVGVIVMVASLVLVTWTVYSQEKLMRMYIRTAHRHNERRLALVQRRQEFARDIMKQAIAYSAMFFVTQMFPFLSLMGISKSGAAFQTLHLVLRPLQGLFNLIVFLYHKVYNLRRDQPELSKCAALGKVFTSQDEPEHIISRISLVRGQQDLGVIEFEGDDMSEYESNNESSLAGDGISRNVECRDCDAINHHKKSETDGCDSPDLTVISASHPRKDVSIADEGGFSDDDGISYPDSGQQSRSIFSNSWFSNAISSMGSR